MKDEVIIEYIRVNGKWTWRAEKGGVVANGDLYPGSRKGQMEMKRDAAEAIKHLRKKGNIKVKR